MRVGILISTALIILVAVGYSLSVHQQTAEAAPPKNLKVLPKKTTKAQVKKIMKKFTKALGVECDYCHSDDGYDKDTKHKKIARRMMSMTNRANTKYLKKHKARITCQTCHRGKKKPKK